MNAPGETDGKPQQHHSRRAITPARSVNWATKGSYHGALAKTIGVGRGSEFGVIMNGMAMALVDRDVPCRDCGYNLRNLTSFRAARNAAVKLPIQFGIGWRASIRINHNCSQKGCCW